MSELHVLPVGDFIEHRFEECPCGVRTEHVPSEDGPDGWVVVHYSLDGREHVPSRRPASGNELKGWQITDRHEPEVG